MAKYHAVVMANPAQGHVIPAMELAQRLVIKVTFVNTEAIHQKVVTSTWLVKNGHNSLLQMVSIPDGLEPWEDRMIGLTLMDKLVLCILLLLTTVFALSLPNVMLHCEGKKYAAALSLQIFGISVHVV
ncbi:hypothetical protein Tco_0084924 [Tanacetum coccineum]